MDKKVNKLRSRLKYKKSHFDTDKENNNDDENGDLEAFHVNETIDHHRLAFDPNLPADSFLGEYEYSGLDNDSPYPEVRAAVPNTDDPSLPVSTIRVWVLGMLVTTIFSALNVLFSLHTPTFTISSFVGSLVVWPMGRAWEKYMPHKKFWGMELNPGPFNMKEHALITIMGNISFGEGPTYAADITVTLRKFYKVNYGILFELMCAVTIQSCGYSMAGLMKKLLIYPASMIWPSNLATSTFLTNIHMNINHVANGWNVSRLRFFFYVWVFSALWYWIPGYLATFLSYTAFPTWFAPKNVIVNQLFGAQTGLGFVPMTFDWNVVSGYIGSPLITPAFSIANMLTSTVLFFWVLTPICYYSNWAYSKYLPISDSNSYDRFANLYNASRILGDSLNFDLEKYKNYSPIFISATFALSYGLSFASITAAFVHTILYHGKDIIYYFKTSRNEPDDIHLKLMRNYKEVPAWWYVIVFVASFSFAIVTILCWKTELPVWALIFALLIAFVFLIPVGMIYAITNIEIGLNVITEFIIGYLIPGKPLAMMLFKSYGYITNGTAVIFLQDMKLGHYLKIPPKTLFAAQLISSLWGGIVQILFLTLADETIADLCIEGQKARFTCHYPLVFFNASIIWGAIGPRRQFGENGIYKDLLWFFLIGAILPVFTWLIMLKWPKSWVRYIHWPVFFNGSDMIPPATPFNYGTYGMVGLIFGYYIKRKYFSWWAKYNYTLSAGLDIGLAIGSLIIFLTITLTSTGTPNWWGNNIVDNTLDTKNTAIMIGLKDGEAFGPKSWS